MKRGKKPLPPEVSSLKSSKSSGDGFPDEFFEGDWNPPINLKDEALEEWRRIVPILSKSKVIAQSDRSILEIYCSEWQTWSDSMAMLREKGIVVNTPNGPKTAPWAVTCDKAAKNCRLLLEQLGCTPSGRARVKITHEEKDELDEFL